MQQTWLPYVAQELRATGWVDRPRALPRSPVLDTAGLDPFESIRTVRRAAVGTHLVRATLAGSGYAAITSTLEDGVVVRRGPTWPTMCEAIDDASAEIERLLSEPRRVSGP